ncbi:MAG: hypothetical protein M0P95_11985 [Sulfuritalea sp.]|jgi:hypothetical protein|nr:hypothetical protein [Sulfuritalea sp.]
MKAKNAALRIAIIFSLHVAFLFGAYGSHFFGLENPYNLTIYIWLGASSLVAALAYRSTLAQSRILGTDVGGEPIPSIYDILIACVSLFAGVFLAFNTYGT